MLTRASLLANNLLRLLLRSGDVSFFTYFPCTSAGFDASFLLFFRESITQGSETSTARRSYVMARPFDSSAPSRAAREARKVNIF